MSHLLCVVRSLAVTDSPEERIRQRLLHWMIDSLGYPKSLLAVEKALKDLPHLQNSPLSFPSRRADLLCYRKDRSLLTPLLLIECKAVPLKEGALRQIEGYNAFVQADFIALANESEIRTGRKIAQGYEWKAGLPAFKGLS